MSPAIIYPSIFVMLEVIINICSTILYTKEYNSLNNIKKFKSNLIL